MSFYRTLSKEVCALASRRALGWVAIVLLGSVSAAAFPVSYTVSGQLGGVVSGPDGLNLANKSFSISGSVDSATSTGNLQLSVGTLNVSLQNVSVGFSAGSPGSISVSSTVLGIPFSARIQLNLPSSHPVPFPSEGLAGGGTVSYGATSNVTVLSVAGGTAVATSTAPTMSASPTSLSFSAQVGTAPPGQTLTINAPSPVPFSAAAGAPWVTLSTTAGTTGSSGSITVGVDPTQLPNSGAAGNYSGSVTITSSAVLNSPLSIPVSLTVTASNNLIASPGSLAFSYQVGGAQPPSQAIALSSSGASLSFTASASSGGAWLSITPSSGSTPSSITVSVSPSALSGGNYNGVVTIKPAEGAAVSIPVSLNVAAPTTLTAAPANLTFTSTTTAPPPAQPVQIGNPKATSFTASTSTNSGGNWLSVDPANGTTPTKINVSVNPSGLSVGSYSGVVTVSPGGGQAPLFIPVTYNVVLVNGLEASPPTLTFASQAGSAGPGALALSVGGTSGINFTAAAATSTGGNWLIVAPTTGASPANLTVTANGSGLAAGTYTGTITLTPSGTGTPVTVPVTYTVSTAPSLVTGNSALAFAYQSGGTAPANRAVTLSSTGPVINANAAGFTNSGGPWLTVTPSTASTPGSVNVGVNPAGLAPAVYTGAVTVSAPGATNPALSIPIVLSVGSSAGIAASPNTLSFAATVGGSSPDSQTMDLASSAAQVKVAVSATTATGGQWLSVFPTAGTAPGSLSVSANTQGLAIGTYTGTISLDWGGASPWTVPVNLVVSPPPPNIAAITDAASLVSGSLAPLSIFTIFGTNLGPKEITTFQLSGGSIGTTLADTQVLFNGVAAPLLMVSANQVNAIVPGSVAAGSTVNVQMIYKGVKSNEFSVQIASAAPALFTQAASGKGQGAILNQDSSGNSASNPAAAGSIVVLFANGAGVANPPQRDGSITPSAIGQIPALVQKVSVQIAGANAEILYAGPAPGEVAGVTQINARIPAGTNSGAVPVTVTVGSATSQTGVTVAVK